MSRSLATFWAVRRAHRPVVRTPKANTTAPQATTIHHPTWLADAKPVANDPSMCAVTSDPMTATPSAEPTWRLVDAIAAATPACDRGMPDTAVLVIGALSIPNPTPKIT